MINTPGVSKPTVKLFYALNGFDTLRQVHKVFYDKIYAHPWLSQFFTGHEQQFIEDQQTHFMAEKMGGPRQYFGKTPEHAHKHMFITEELFNTRQALLRESLKETGVPEELAKQWLKIDAAFHRQIIKHDLSSFHESNKLTFKPLLVIEKPRKSAS